MLPSSNDLQFASVRNEFLDEPETRQATWSEAIGFEAAEHARQMAENEARERAIHEAVEQASESVDAARIDRSSAEARQIARSADNGTGVEYTAEAHGYFINHAKGYGKGVRALRDFSKSNADIGDFDIAA